MSQDSPAALCKNFRYRNAAGLGAFFGLIVLTLLSGLVFVYNVYSLDDRHILALRFNIMLDTLNGASDKSGTRQGGIEAKRQLLKSGEALVSNAALLRTQMFLLNFAYIPLLLGAASGVAYLHVGELLQSRRLRKDPELEATAGKVASESER